MRNECGGRLSIGMEYTRQVGQKWVFDRVYTERYREGSGGQVEHSSPVGRGVIGAEGMQGQLELRGRLEVQLSL
jgi:hypothetical protein